MCAAPHLGTAFPDAPLSTSSHPLKWALPFDQGTPVCKAVRAFTLYTSHLGHSPGPLSVMEDGESSGPRLRLGAPRGGARGELEGAARVSKGSGMAGRCAPAVEGRG